MLTCPIAIVVATRLDPPEIIENGSTLWGGVKVAHWAHNPGILVRL